MTEMKGGMQLLNRGAGTISAVVNATESHLANRDAAIFCQCRLLLPGITTAVHDSLYTHTYIYISFCLSELVGYYYKRYRYKRTFSSAVFYINYIDSILLKWANRYITRDFCCFTALCSEIDVEKHFIFIQPCCFWEFNQLHMWKWLLGYRCVKNFLTYSSTFTLM